jgi:hypothetical protein
MCSVWTNKDSVPADAMKIGNQNRGEIVANLLVQDRLQVGFIAAILLSRIRESPS